MEINLYCRCSDLRDQINKVIFNDPATIVLWKDGTKTVVKCNPDDIYTKHAGLAMCIAKKALGNTGSYFEVFKEWIVDEDEPKFPKFADIIASLFSSYPEYTPEDSEDAEQS